MAPIVLVVEDESSIAELVELYLKRAGYQVRLAADLASARKALEDPSIALVLLDLTLPDGDGLDFFRTLKRKVPVIMLTARDDVADKVLGLELGAEDYISKPFSPREIVARVRTVLRRFEPDNADAPIAVGPLRLDPQSRELTVNDASVELTRKEFDLLHWLMATPGRVYSREQLLESVWEYGPGVDTRTVDVHVAQLRAKLPGVCPIKTVRGVGYRAG